MRTDSSLLYTVLACRALPAAQAAAARRATHHPCVTQPQAAAHYPPAACVICGLQHGISACTCGNTLPHARWRRGVDAWQGARTSITLTCFLPAACAAKRHCLAWDQGTAAT